MAKRSFTYRFKVSATNEGYERSQVDKPHYVPNEIIYTFGEEVEKILERDKEIVDWDCDSRTFVIKREDLRFPQQISLKKNIDVLHYQVKDIVRNYLIHYRSHKQDTCIVEYELLRKNNFSKNEYISDNVQEEVKFIVNAIKAIGENTLSNPNKELRAMLRRQNWALQIEAPLNYVSSEIFQILNVRTTSDSIKDARKYLRNFITAFFRLIPKNVIEKYDTLYENREKEMKKKAARDKESCERLSSYDRGRADDDDEALALVSRFIKYHLTREIGYIIHCVYKDQKFCFQSFANWKKAIINFLEIDEVLTLYEDSKETSDILKEISNEGSIKDVKYFLSLIDDNYDLRGSGKAEVSAIFFNFLTVCQSKYLNDKYKRKVGNVGREYKRQDFKDLCLQYFGLKPNSLKPKDCVEVQNSKLISNKKTAVWDKIRNYGKKN